MPVQLVGLVAGEGKAYVTRLGCGGSPAPSRESIEGAAETSDRGVPAVSSMETGEWCSRE
jgi:hypothetical protein